MKNKEDGHLNLHDYSNTPDSISKLIGIGRPQTVMDNS